MTYPFLQAKYYTVGRGGRQVKQVFLHTAEDQKLPGAAKRIWQWFFGKSAPKASAHLIIDAKDIEQSVKLTDTAWAVGDWYFNQTSISIEMCCAAKDWSTPWRKDAYLVALLNNTAKVTAELCFQFKIPPIKLTPAQLLLGRKGLAGHIDVTIAKKIRGGHTDPSLSFPWNDFVKLVQHHLATIR